MSAASRSIWEWNAHEEVNVAKLGRGQHYRIHQPIPSKQDNLHHTTIVRLQQGNTILSNLKSVINKVGLASKSPHPFPWSNQHAQILNRCP